MPLESDQLAKIQTDYQARLPEKSKQVGDLWNKLQYFNWNDQAFKLLYQLVHNLAGNGKTFGFASVSEQAQILEQYLSSVVGEEQPPDEGQRSHISVLVQSLIEACNPNQNEAEAHSTQALQGESITDQRSRHLVYVVDDDQHMGDYLAQHLQSLGYVVHSFLSTASLWRTLERETAAPSVVVMDIVHPEGSFAGIEAIERLRDMTGERTPVVFLSARTDMNARLRALRAGGDAYITKPVEIDRLVRQIDSLTLPRPEHDVRVLFVGDSGQLSGDYQTVLSGAGMAVQVVNRAMETLEQLAKWKPDVLLVDYQTPECDGFELAQIIRQHEEYITLPIIFLADNIATVAQDQLLGIGAHVVLQKPVSGEQLVHEIEKLAKTARRILNKVKEVSRRDPVTGLDNRRYFFTDLENVLSVIHAYGTTHYFFYIMLDHLEIIRERYGIFELSSLVTELACFLRAQLDAYYSASALSEGVFGVLVTARKADQAEQLAHQMLSKIAGHRFTIDGKAINVTCSLGLVKVTPDTKTVKDLLRRAERLAERSSEAGGNVVQSGNLFDDDGDSAAQGQARVEKMVRALQSNAFQLMFQPILNVSDSGKEMYEALVRLVDEDGHTILPLQFMDTLQEMGLLLELDRWVTEQMLVAASKRATICPPTDYLIKLSVESLRAEEFTDFLAAALANDLLQTGHRIIFELSEKLVLVHTQLVASFVQTVSALGCSVAIDHFGSTSNSLRLLDEIPALLVKVHNTVINNIGSDEPSRKYIHALIRGAQQKNVQVVVGALEDPRSLSILCEWGVTDFQGYLIQEPNDAIQLDIEDAVLSTGG